MRIDRPGSVRSGGPARSGRASGARGGDFARRLEQGAAPAPGASLAGATPLNSIAALLAVQGVGDALDGPARRAATSHAEDLLNRLELLRDGILAGTVSRGALEQLLTRVRARPEGVIDPKLAEILADIELRASVELAKLDML